MFTRTSVCVSTCNVNIPLIFHDIVALASHHPLTSLYNEIFAANNNQIALPILELDKRKYKRET